jgi:hypothetical protein
MSVELFDSLDDMLDADDKAREAADKRTTDSQKELKKGDYFVNDSGYGFPKFGQVLKEYKNKRLQNYRLCECYSVAVPYGERGDVHVSTIGYKIDEKLFNKLWEKGWSM